MAKSAPKKNPEIEKIVDESKEDFDLESSVIEDVDRRLMNRPMRTKKVVVYNDEVTGEELGGVRRDVNEAGIVTNIDRWGILGEIDIHKSALPMLEKLPESENVTEAIKARKAEIAKLKKKAAPLRKKLESTSFEFNLTAVPPIIRDDVRRQARKAMKIKGKNVPDEMLEEYADVYTAHMLATSTTSWVDHETGETHTTLTPKRALKFKQYLPEGEFKKLDDMMGHLQWRRVISDAVTADADF